MGIRLSRGCNWRLPRGRRAEKISRSRTRRCWAKERIGMYAGEVVVGHADDYGILHEPVIKMMKMTFGTNHLLAIGAVALLLLGGICCDQGGVAEVESGRVLARIDEGAVTEDEFKTALARAAEKSPRSYPGIDKPESVLRHLVDEELVYKKALEEGYDKHPEVARLLRQAMVGRYLARNLKPLLEGVEVSEDEISTHYRGHLDRYRTHEMARVAVISIRVPSGTDDAGRLALVERARAALEEARALPAEVADFGDLAARYSDDKRTRQAGGDVGWIIRRAGAAGLPLDLQEAVLDLDERGALTPVVETPAALYIGRLMEIRPSRLRPLSAVRKAVKELLLRQAKDTARKGFYSGLREGRDISIDHELLEEIGRPPAPVGPAAEGGEARGGASSQGTLRRAVEKLRTDG